MGYEPAWGLYFNTQAGRRIFRSTWNGLYGSLSGGSRGGALRARAPTLFLDHTEARRAEEDFFDTVPAAPLSQGLDDRPSPPSPHLRVWIRHCLFSWPRDRSVSRCMEDSYFCHFKCAYIKYTDEWWRSRKRWKPPAESTMNHPFIPGGSHEKRCGDGRRDIISKETNLGVVQTLLMFICWAWK